MNIDDLIKRIDERLHTVGLSATEASKRATGSDNTIRTIRKKSMPGFDKIIKLAPVLKTTITWLAYGVDLKKHTGLSEGPAEPFKYDFPRSDTPILEIDVRAGMGGGGEALTRYVPDGHGGMMESDDVRAEWVLPDDYLKSELHVNQNQSRIFEVQGDSMEPTLRSGDRVMVHIGDKRPSPPGIFALWDGFGVVVKRVEHIPNSDPPALKVKSDNQFHDEYERTAEEVNIIGRVVWYSRRL